MATQVLSKSGPWFGVLQSRASNEDFVWKLEGYWSKDKCGARKAHILYKGASMEWVGEIGRRRVGKECRL